MKYILLVVLCALSTLVAEEEFYPWMALDSQTIAVFHMRPEQAVGQGIALAQLAESWKSLQIIDQIVAALPEQEKEMLKQYGFDPEMLSQLLAGPWGAALLRSPSEDWQALLWMEPGEELLTQLIAGLQEAGQQRLRQHQEGTASLIEVRGPQIASKTIVEADGSVRIEEYPADGSAPSLLLLPDGPRLLISIQPDHQEKSAYVKTLYAFHQRLRNQQAGSFAGRIAASTAVQETIAAIPLWYELYCDFPALLADQAEDLLQVLGLQQLGLLGLRAGFDEQRLLSGLFLEAPAPRSGLLAIGDQQALRTAFPDWMPSDVQEAHSISLDLSTVLGRLRSLMPDMGPAGERIAGRWAGMDQALRMFFGMNAEELLAALGDRHYLIRLSPQESPPEDLSNWEQALMQLRFAWVMNVRDPQRVASMLTSLANMVNMSGILEAKLTQEAGFAGWRMTPEATGSVGIGLFSDEQHLFFALGTDLDRQLISQLTQPPSGDQQLARDPDLTALLSHLPSRPAIIYSYQDLSTARQINPSLFSSRLLGQAHDDFPQALHRHMELLLQSLGKLVTQVWVDASGWGLQNIIEFSQTEATEPE